MAPLLSVLELSAVSELPSACSETFSTTAWHSFNHLENRLRQENSKIYLLSHIFWGENISLTRIIKH